MPTRIAVPLLLAALTAPAWADITGKVVAVADGDTITVLQGREQVKVRLSGIDAPERKQPFGERARANMSRLVFGKEVLVAGRKRDRFGSVVGRVLVASDDCKQADCPKTLDASLAQLKLGLAWHYKRFEHEQPEYERGQYVFAEGEARAKRAGLWQDADAVPPWVWRSSK
ncbi:MAG: thermonuclease family protein [Burkholderiales bacterium]|nr:thermonuclease family protein [Burkholderiales bacterium]